MESFVTNVLVKIVNKLQYTQNNNDGKSQTWFAILLENQYNMGEKGVTV